MRTAHLGLLRCSLAAALFGASTPLAARIAHEISAPLLAGLLYLGAAAAVAPFALTAKLGRVRRRAAGQLSVAVVAGGFLGPLLLAGGLSRTTGAAASLLLNLELVATLVLAAVFFGEHLGRRVVLGGALVLCAGALLAFDGGSLQIGAVLVAAACLCWGLDNCVTANLDGVSPAQITLLKGAIAGSTNLALGVITGSELPSVTVVFGALVVGAVGYGVSTTLWVAGARDIGAARGQLVFSAAPFLGVIVAWALLGDEIRGVESAALLLAAIGVAAAIRSGHVHRHQHERLAHSHEHAHDEDHHQHRHAQPVVRHTHDHSHEPVAHAHAHVPDLHHRHG